LSGQAKHQIQIEIIEACTACCCGRMDGFLRAVYTFQRLQLQVIQALDAYRQAVHTSLAVTGKLFLFHGAGIGFQGNFSIGTEGQPRPHATQQLVYGLW